MRPKREDFTERETHLIMEAFAAGKRDALLRVKEAIKPCLDYCKAQNGRSDCKNCGLSEDTITRLLE